jgi:hypothetical protein
MIVKRNMSGFIVVLRSQNLFSLMPATAVMPAGGLAGDPFDGYSLAVNLTVAGEPAVIPSAP